MQSRLKRLFFNLDLEERILASASLFTFISVFFPWMSGQWNGVDDASFSGTQFFTAYIGIVILFCALAILAITIIPAIGVHVPLKRKQREIVRISLSILSTTLTLAALSVLINITYEYTLLDIRYGIYGTFVGSIVSSFYAILKLQEFRKSEPQELFHHPETPLPQEERRETFISPPPPPPPPPLQPEEYRNVRR